MQKLCTLACLFEAARHLLHEALVFALDAISRRRRRCAARQGRLLSARLLLLVGNAHCRRLLAVVWLGRVWTGLRILRLRAVGLLRLIGRGGTVGRVVRGVAIVGWRRLGRLAIGGGIPRWRRACM